MDGTLPPPPPYQRRQPLLPSGVMGMLIFATAEIMFFAGMMSAFTIVRSSSLPLMWPPPGQPLLPAFATGLNTAALLASAVALFFAHRGYHRAPGRAAGALAICLGLGSTFVLLQGREWVALLRQGLTMTSSNLGSFFYLIVGAHAAHAVVALVLLGWALQRLRAGALEPNAFYAVQTCWYFVVGLWPVIYARVYF